MNIDCSFDYAVPTSLCAIMEKYGSDKGSATERGHNKHNYTTFYYNLFKDVKDDQLRIFEMGLGTNNTSIVSNMGAQGKPGASLYGWREFFGAKALIFGADIDRGILFQSDRIQTFYCDQTSPNSVVSLWLSPALEEGFDVILDDGLHNFEANKCLFEGSIHKLKPHGVYIIEDIFIKNLYLYVPKLQEWATKYNLIFKVINIPHERNKNDNCLIVFQKSSEALAMYSDTT